MRHLAYLIKEAAGWGSEGAEDERAVAFAEASEEEGSGREGGREGEGVTRETACSEEGEDGGGGRGGGGHTTGDALMRHGRMGKMLGETARKCQGPMGRREGGRTHTLLLAR